MLQAQFIFTDYSGNKYKIISYKEIDGVYICQQVSPVAGYDSVYFEICTTDIKSIEPATKPITARIKATGKVFDGTLNMVDGWFEVFGEGIAPEDLGCYELHAIEILKGKQKEGFTFEQWGDVKDMVKKAKRAEEKTFNRGQVYKFHYHGLFLNVGEKQDLKESYVMPITFKQVKSMVEDAKRDYPGQKIEVSLEGHWDWWESYQSMFEGGEYEPTDIFIEIPLYKNF